MSEEDLMKKGQLQESHSKSLNLSGNFVMSYNQPVGDNSLLTVNLGGDIYKDDSKSQNFVGTGFLKPELHSPQYASAYKEDSHPGGSQELTTRAGFLLISILFCTINTLLTERYVVPVLRSLGLIIVMLLSGRLAPVGICIMRRFYKKSG